MNTLLNNLIDAIEVSTSEHAVGTALRRFSDECGAERFAYLSLRTTDVRVLTNYCQEWKTHYFENKYMRIDPVILNARRAMRAFTWSCDHPVSLTAQERRFLGEAAEFGIRSGVSVPVHLAFGRVSILTLASSQRRFELNLAQSFSKAQVALVYIHMRLNSHLESQESIGLTTRQAMCLEWASLGKTVAETARILGISDRSVTFHLNEARTKLNANNIAHAVRVAMDLHLIPK
ncbi:MULTISPECIES: autoinducer binding domain-containing protein [Rhizobium]|uniref:autoinducer binding domain-containing protein n=1 Tax=Rhizobium TaxID=379 RepID=UPI001C82A545|nr:MULTISPECIES: autoinducer binding domain-containing protein [Rhizobium]MBX4899638.1 transcriptional regulator [Rhizobium bangladeshense]MBX5297556.1 transcriptional regulator [Rhizobium sp. NLR15a]MBY3617816.1 autoinducer binding domain-containing protein [Rhizobium bangladeshense]